MDVRQGQSSKDGVLFRHQSATERIAEDSYNPTKYLSRASLYQELGYPDLAVGDAYKALLLLDEILDDSGEYHDQASASFEASVQDLNNLQHSIYKVLVSNLLDCKCFKSSLTFVKQWDRLPSHSTIIKITVQDVLDRYTKVGGTVPNTEDIESDDLPDRTSVRREIYPWNKLEPDRNSNEYVSALNKQLEKVAPKCEVRVSEYPILTGGSGFIKQLGLFAKDDIDPGEVVLKEKSLLTVNNNLHDTLCDACSSELPELGGSNELFSCPECDDIVFCTQLCLDAATESYHSAVCGKDLDSIARDTEAKEASDALYFLLLARTIAMAETQEEHPLRLKEVSSLWGDFVEVPVDPSHARPSLPFSFTYNILYPIHLLTQMDMDIYATTPKYDFWILNTLYAKFRGVASARPNLRTGKPEVCAVHPLWCLANHSCAPNVSWEWSGDIKLVSRQGHGVVRWGPDKDALDRWRGGIKQGEEILNHYCDVELDVRQRREWAQGPLGGDCMCQRCIWEADHDLDELINLRIEDKSNVQ